MSSLFDQAKAFIECVKSGGHDFVDGVCSRCAARAGDPSIADLIVGDRRVQLWRELAAHQQFVARLAAFMDVQSGLSRTPERYDELFQCILKLREQLLEQPGFYPALAPPAPPSEREIKSQLDVWCPKCGALPGQPCASNPTTGHAQRINAFEWQKRTAH